MEARAAGCHLGDNSGTPSRIPEFLQVVGDGCDRIAAALRREEFADLIGHHHQLVGGHRIYSAATLAMRRPWLACSAALDRGRDGTNLSFRPFDRVLARDSNDGFVNTDQQAGVIGGSYSA
jgi:hypothetical protein